MKGVIMSYIGKWRITETSAWDMDDLDEEDAFVEFRKGAGIMKFDYIRIEMDVVEEQIEGVEILAYSFSGYDEDEEISGWGWFRQTESKDDMDGRIYFHHGDMSDVKIEKCKEGR
jgi:hypothetical protein